MSTDRERLVALLDEWGVGYNGRSARGLRGDVKPTDVVLCEGDAKITGYGEFYAIFEFDEHGAFQRVAVWE